MSNFGAIFIQLQEKTEQEFDEINARLKKKGYLFTLRDHQTKPWVQIWIDEPENLPFYLKDIAPLFLERRIIGIACQSVVDAIGYWEVTNGQEKRTLEYGFTQERTWEKVEGEPQSWETEIFEGREGYEGLLSLKVGETQPYFSNFDIQRLGQILDLPGFGTPATREKWTREVFN